MSKTMCRTPKANLGANFIKAFLVLSLLALTACEDGINLSPPPVVDENEEAPVVIVASNVSLNPIGVFETGIFDSGAAEIVAFDATNDQVFVVNSAATRVDVLDISNPVNPALVTSIDASGMGGAVNSVAVANNVVAVVIEAFVPQDPGTLAFYNADTFDLINTITVGAQPDMVAFSPNGGNFVLVANEGEPSDDLNVDPNGSVTIINVSNSFVSPDVLSVEFTDFNPPDLAEGEELTDTQEALQQMLENARVTTPGATPAQGFEPEFITFSANGLTAFVTLQENNAIAVIDILTPAITNLISLGSVDHSLAGNELDVSDIDGGINIGNQPVSGFLMPDAIATFTVAGVTFLVTANEGDSREFNTFSDVSRVEDLTLDPTAFPNAAELQLGSNLGRLQVSNVDGDIDGDGDFDQLFSFGSRSFSIFTSVGELVYDSGSDFEDIIAAQLPLDFNSDNDQNNSFDSRSDNSGPEPEGVVLGQIQNQVFAFIALERVGGIMIYDITNPSAPVFQSYVNVRNFDVPAQNTDGSTNSAVGDLGPEGIVFVSAANSPTNVPLLIVGNEVSGTTRIFEVTFETNG